MNDRSNLRSATEPAAVALLDAVERIFTEESPSAVSMLAIAAEAGCSLGLAYNFFASKDELMGAARPHGRPHHCRCHQHRRPS